MKEDVLQDLPPKIIQDYYCDLGKVQQMLYEDFQASSASKQAIKSVEDDSGSSEAGHTAAPQHIFQTLQYLRKLCNHPMLALDQDIERYKQIVHRAWYDDGQGVPRDPFDVGHSPKLLALQYVNLLINSRWMAKTHATLCNSLFIGKFCLIAVSAVSSRTLAKRIFSVANASIES